MTNLAGHIKDKMVEKKMNDDIYTKLCDNLVDLKMDEILALVKQGISDKIPAYDMVMKGLNEGMKEIGRRFEIQEYYLAELMFASEIMNKAIDLLKPHMQTSMESTGTVLIGTVEGDHHDIGKNIVGTILKTSGIKIIDLGVDVQIETWIEKIKELKPDIVGLSCLMAASISSMRNTIQAIQKNHLRDQVKIVIGGGAVSEIIAEQIGADAFAYDAMVALKIIKKLLD